MAATLRRAGLDVVLWNRSRQKSDDVAAATGARVATTAADAAGAATVVVTSLADDTAVRDVYMGSRGVLEGVGPGTTVVETSTISPSTSREVGAAVDATGAGFIDAPVSGSVSTVHAGALTIMVGGDTAILERARPVLDPLATTIVHVGDRGAGAATKLAVNGLVHGLNVALCEALVLAEKAGVDRSSAYEVFANGAGGAPFVHYKRDAFEHPEDAPVAFSLALVAKDLELITGLGEEVDAPMRQAAIDLDIVNEAIAHGMGDRDMSAIAIHLRGGT